MKKLCSILKLLCARECIESDNSYKGYTSVTISGKSCQNWSKNYPHRPKHTPENKNHNYCRNPDGDEKVWCYTTDRNTRWEYCNIPSCPTQKTNCHDKCWKEQTSYRGQISQTKSGAVCQRWPSSYNLDHNFCRNPDFDPEGPWCFISDNSQDYEYCDVPHCSTCAKPLGEVLVIAPVGRQIPVVCGKPNYEPTFSSDEDQPDTLNTRGGRSRRSAYNPDPGVIYGGGVAKHQRHPWQVKLSSTISCGGTLITMKTVITAAHCLVRSTPGAWKVSAGHISKYNPEDSKQIRSVRKMVIHENYSTTTHDSDIAIMILTTPFEYNKYVRPACLPEPDFAPQGGSKCIISGWGKTERGSALQLMQNVIPMRSFEKCQSMLGRLSENMICGGREGEDTCQGDSGGPLICKVGDIYTLTGVTSFGYGCGEAQKPGVYVKVSNFLPWINKNKV